MAKSALRIQALELRRNGVSIRGIAHALKVSKSTASLWCRDVLLSEEQIEKLQQDKVMGGYRGRLKGAQVQKQRKLERARMHEGEGLKVLGRLSKRDLLLVGLGLHLGEGTKVGNRVRFTNSNPLIIKLFLVWAGEIFGVVDSRIYCRVMINEVHRDREGVVKKEWSKILGIPPSQFQKTTFIKAKTMKIYENHDSFLGTLAVTVLRSSDLQLRILGLTKGLVYKLCERKPA